ncbi:MAG: hypothetical protein ACTTH7_06490 [Treponema sp.]
MKPVLKQKFPDRFIVILSFVIILDFHSACRIILRRCTGLEPDKIGCNE